MIPLFELKPDPKRSKLRVFKETCDAKERKKKTTLYTFLFQKFG